MFLHKSSNPLTRREALRRVGNGFGMMAGVMSPSGSGATDEDKKKMLPVTALGRYLKILLSSNEFLFID